ncbi:MAG TPA: DUF4272 domain-containing protein [Planctomycetaceae bacterium]|jgi:hypothetical protein|nr:DUF4272 domain-containing protein [Planctomycetaceae bacterium]
MAFEPINIFSRRIDPRGVVEVLHRSGFEVKVEGPEDDWTRIIVTLKKGTLFSKPRVMTFGHDSNYYDGDGWQRQVMGMQGYFSRFPDTPTQGDILRLIGTFRFALSVPQHDLNIDSNDERLKLLVAVCRHLDGAIFTPSSLRDAEGRILIDAAGQADPSAIMPRMPPPAVDVLDDSAEQGDDFDPIPPSPERVARRALALTVVAARAVLELDAPHFEAPDSHRQRLLNWFKDLDIGDELEPDEWKVLQRPVGGIDPQDHINAMWRVEGLAVLAWALELHKLPPDDELIDPGDHFASLGLFDVAVARECLRSPKLRAAEELGVMQTHLLMLHWRLRSYSIHRASMDFAAYSKSCWLGSFDISAFRLIDNDLAIGSLAIHDAEEAARKMVSSLALERHLAINWLMGYSEIYSETDTST